MFESPPWMRRGFCVGANPEIFYAEDQIETAVGYCQRCMVRDVCLAWALKNNEYGVWGATTEKERQKAQRIVKRASCPTCGGKTIHKIDNQSICVPCGTSWQTSRSS